MTASFAESFLMDPVAVSVELGFGERFVKGNVVGFAEVASLFPGVAFDGEAFEGTGEREVSEESVGEFVEEEETEVLVGFEVKNGFFGSKEKFATGFERELGIGSF